MPFPLASFLLAAFAAADGGQTLPPAAASNDADTTAVGRVDVVAVVPLDQVTAGVESRPSNVAVDPTAYYSNLSGFSGVIAPFGNTAAFPIGLSTTMGCDDLTVGGGAPSIDLGRVRFTIANQNNVAMRVTPTIVFYQSDDLRAPRRRVSAPVRAAHPVTIPANAMQIVQLDIAMQTLWLDATRTLWACVFYDNFDDPSAGTVAQMNQLGAALFDPIAIGSSSNILFVNVDPHDNMAERPLGSLFFYDTVPSNFGWELLPVPPDAIFANGFER